MLKNSKTNLKNVWAQVPTDYYFNLNYFQKTWHEWKFLIFKHLLTLENFYPKTVLEIGCSSGHLTYKINQLFPKAQITGVDVYAPVIKEAKKRYPKLSFNVADAHKLPFKNNSFDTVVCSETIEHVINPGVTLQEIRRVLTENGKALIEMDSGSLLFRIVWYLWTTFGKGRVWNDAHLHPFTASELEQTIHSNGFNIEKKIFSHFGMAVSFLVSKK